MTEGYNEPTRYLIFRLTPYTRFLAAPASTVLGAITASEPRGITFEELMKHTHIGPKHLKAILKTLFDQDYIITNHSISTLKAASTKILESLRQERRTHRCQNQD